VAPFDTYHVGQSHPYLENWAQSTTGYWATIPDTGFYVKGLNFEIAFVTQEQSESMIGFVQPGAMVSRVDPGPAQEAGFHAQDMVIEINGEKIVTKDDLRHAVREIGNGKVSFTLKNESGMRTVSVDCRNCNDTP
jgi:S1-C subfamily serine protease